MNDDAEIIAEFLVESHENLDQLDRDLVALEQSPGSRELLSSIFRAIHTIKGTSGFLALHRLESLTHAGENLLSRLRDGELVMGESTTGVLLQMVDATRALLEVVERTGTDLGDGPDIVPIVEAVDALLVAPVVAPVVASVVATPEVRLGEVMVARGEVTPGDVGEAVAEQLRGDSRPLGEILVALGSTEPEAVDAALAEQSGAVSEGEAGPRRASVVDSSVRVDVDLLDSLVQLVGELVLTRNQILQKLDGVEDLDLVRAAQRLNLVASELQEGVMKTRMQPIGQVWAKMPRVVRDLGQQLGRKVSLELEGHDTELDRSLLEALKGPLTHLVRNALDHGLEPPAERAARGKAEEGRLMLRAFHESGQVVVEISDDGRGIDTDRVAAVAVKRGVVTQEQVRSMEPRELQGLIFSPGFSTAAEVTNVSGRGVGMDVVRTNIEGIGGTVDLSSAPSCGTTVRVRIPLTLAIIPALLVGEGDDIYAVPQANLVELVRIEGEERDQALHDLAGAPVLRLRGRLLPLVFLADTLGRPGRGPTPSPSSYSRPTSSVSDSWSRTSTTPRRLW